jgi:CBS domain containing-hemolysin-like protein
MEGVVTFEDLLEELVGEIYDESDQKPVEFVELGLNKISVDGTAEVRLIEEYFDTELPGKSTDTINRWILDHTERIPITGETFALDDFEVLVKSATRRRIHEVTIERLAQAPTLLDM